MRLQRWVRPLAIVMLMCLLALPTGCKRATRAVVAHWPRADAERTVAGDSTPRWPLTGLPAPSASAISRRVLSIKVENSPEARPQTNLQRADVVYESVTEGGITRFNALFQSTDPDRVGPVRSARLSDLSIVPQYHALFFFSGASSTVNGRVNAAGIENLSEDAGISAPYLRSSDRRAPHNLYIIPTKARAEAVRRKMASSRAIEGLAFGASGDESTQTVNGIYVPFSPANKVQWTYDKAANAYQRVDNGRPHIDKATGRQLSARNVVVLWARYTPASHDKVGSTTYDITLVGTGRVSVFHDGVCWNGTWSATKDAPPRFTSADGRQIRLTPGNTWFQVVQSSTVVTLK